MENELHMNKAPNCLEEFTDLVLKYIVNQSLPVFVSSMTNDATINYSVG